MRVNTVIIGVLLAVAANAVTAGTAFAQQKDAKQTAFSLNSYLDPAMKDVLDISGEARHRFEFKDNYDFNSAIADADGYHLVRSRLRIGYTPVKTFKLFAEAQDARIWESSVKTAKLNAFSDKADIRQLYFDFSGLQRGAISLRIGRQELAYGDERLIGGFGWSNVAQSFDAAKVIYKNTTEDFTVDLFAARKVLVDVEDWNEWDEDDKIAGIYSSFNKLAKKHKVDFYALYRHKDKSAGDMNEETLGIRVSAKDIMGYDYEIEAAYQFGKQAGLDIKAFAYVIACGYTLDAPWKPRFGVEWDYATGDSNNADGRRETFDNLFPTNHKFYGYMDLASWQNINNYKFGISVNPDDKLQLQVDAHFIKINETGDALYSAARTPIRTAASTNVNRNVGMEIDFTAQYKINKNAGVLIGYSHFYTGKFLEDTGAADDAEFFYLQTTISF